MPLQCGKNAWIDRVIHCESARLPVLIPFSLSNVMRAHAAEGAASPPRCLFLRLSPQTSLCFCHSSFTREPVCLLPWSHPEGSAPLAQGQHWGVLSLISITSAVGWVQGAQSWGQKPWVLVQLCTCCLCDHGKNINS